jgi:DNA-binding MarR family transcriptional regulator/GNAT superfamily N-acetyltransferase
MDAVDTVRTFNRFYTRHVGALGEHLLDSPYSLTEMRVLYELAHRDGASASDLATELGLDAGYLSRILTRFQSQRLIAREGARDDARRTIVRLTARGRESFAPYEQKTRDNVAAMLAALPATGRRDVLGAMRTLQARLDRSTAASVRAYVLRTHQPGDFGWIVQMHGALYARDYGYDSTFEAVVARIAANFLEQFDPARERCWIAEIDGANVGSVCLVKKSATVAKLRLLIVDPQARGLGIGRRLVDECVGFARKVGYRKMTLWTHGHLSAARRIYESAGFVCVDRQPSTSFGKKLVDETWTLNLSGASGA